MARIEDVERRLLNWARWRLGMTRGGLGFAAVNMATERVDRAGYDAQSSIPTIDVEASDTEDAIGALSVEHQRTVQVVYLDGGGTVRHCARLGGNITPAGINARVTIIHRQLAGWFSDKAAGALVERRRVEALQRPAASQKVFTPLL